MHIQKITTDKKQFLSFLLLADEQEDMIDRYLSRGDLYAAFDGDVPIAVCVVTDEGDDILEIKNLAVAPSHQRRGIGREMIRFIENRYAPFYTTLAVGTGDVPSTRDFYQACGFSIHHRRANFFTDHYDHPIIEDGILLKDMIVLHKSLPPRTSEN